MPSMIVRFKIIKKSEGWKKKDSKELLGTGGISQGPQHRISKPTNRIQVEP